MKIITFFKKIKNFLIVAQQSFRGKLSKENELKLKKIKVGRKNEQR